MLKLALPAGDYRAPVAEFLATAGLRVEGYGEGSRLYRLPVASRDNVRVRIFRERDIPIQVALGNYDVGLCSLSWVVELQARFPRHPVLPLANTGIGAQALIAAAHPSVCPDLSALGRLGRVRIAGEYPNIAEAFARSARLPRYRVQSVWGAAEVYPPEDADVAVISVGDPHSLEGGLQPIFKFLDSSIWVFANERSLAEKDISPLLGPLISSPHAADSLRSLRLPGPTPVDRATTRVESRRECLRLAIPDGHQQRHVYGALRDAGLRFEGYDESSFIRRPFSGLDGLEVKVIRPHDMPQLVATGEIDLAITGRDCLLEHLYSFPSSPAVELVDLQRGQYNMSAVVSEDVPAATIDEALAYWRSSGVSVLRVAAEFPSTADHYARNRHVGRYQVIPIAGASEGFVPEDADLLIEGTETGRTVAENKLKVIDLLFRSTTCVIGRRDADLGPRQRRLYEALLDALRRSVGAAKAV
jgi:ATP phosphoribosyltransferase